MFVVWNYVPAQYPLSQWVLVYNDAALSLLQQASGSTPVSRSPHDCWAENWPIIQTEVEQVFQTGQALQCERQPFLPEFKGYHTELRYIWSYSPIWDETGQIRGVCGTVSRSPDPEQDTLLQVLANERARFEAVLRQMPEGVIIADAASGAMILANEQANHILRHTLEPNLVLETYDQQVPFQAYRANGQMYAPADYPLVRSLQTGEVVTQEEMEIRYEDGTRIVIEANSSPIFDNRGEITSAVVLFQDITARKQTEVALRQSEERARLAIQVGQLGTWRYHLDQNLVEMDERMREIWGIPEDAVILPLAQAIERIHPQDREQVKMAIWAALDPQSSGRYEVDYRLVWDDGTERWVSTNGQVDFVIEGDSRRPIGFFGTALDISDRKQAETQLRASENQLRLLTDALPVLISYVDYQHRYRFVNQTYTDWFGLLPDDIVGKHLEEVLGREAYRAIRPDVEMVLSGQRVSSERHVFFKTVGWRYVQRHFVPDIADDGFVKGYYALVSDVTEHRQAEVALQQSEEQLRLAQRAAGAGLWDWDMLSNQVTWSEEYYRLYGLETSVTPSYENWIACILEPDRAGVEQAVQEALEQRMNLNVEFRILHPIEGLCWITAIGQTFYDTEGQPSRMAGIALNITPRKQAEAEREQLLRREKAIREAAEAAEKRASFLVEASTTLTSSLNYEYTLKSVAQAVVPGLADWCAVDILKDDGTLERLATAHVDPAKVQWGMELYRRYPPNLNAPQGLAQVLRTGKSEYYPTISDDLIVAASQDDEHLKILREIGFSSAMLVPLNARGRTLGIISFVAAESGHSYSLDDLSLAEELARRAAIALDNARLYQDAHNARQTAERAADRTTRLQTVTAALSESLTPEQVAEVIVEQSMATLEATAVLVVLVSRDRTELEIVKSVGYEADLVESWRRFSIDLDVPLAQAVRTGEPVWVETLLERIARFPHLAEVYNRYDFQSWIAIPLVFEGVSVGGMLLSFREFRHLDQDDRAFILALSRQCAQAISRSKLYEAERQARAEAEQANRVKDEFLAVLSHELRSPLNPILGWAKLLQTRKFDESGTKRALETIERNAKLQTDLIDDLLDVSRILRGKMMLNVADVDLVAVIDAAIETVRLSAEAKNITIHRSLAYTAAVISGDANRLQQILWNLLSNAIKFTAPGGRVEVTLEQVQGGHESSQTLSPAYVQIQVSDTGKGITPKFLPHVFDYFRQEDGTTTRKFGGLGLGLAIVRYLTELHGGTVIANSPGEGFGATFTVLLPLCSGGSADSSSTTGGIDVEINRLLLKNLQILVVDDEADMRVLTSTILEQTGAETRVVASGKAALDALKDFKPDILISDIGMPEMDGYEFLHQVRRLAPEQGGQIPAIALTAYAGEFDQQQALAAGFQRHLAKPIEPEALVRAIVAVVQLRLGEIG